MNNIFEWDESKARSNLRKHRVSFEIAKLAFDDRFCIEWLDTRADYREERFILIGLAAGRHLCVVYTERADRIRIISAREAIKYEQQEYYR
ncbi:MAG: BrnT family toxin [Alphaproteobacteria bacterium]|nr:BrnT family toxin [Alphaproteobacteria bacterium]